jgi:hypothetical protein
VRATCRLSYKREGERYFRIPREPVSVVRSLLTVNLLDIDLDAWKMQEMQNRRKSCKLGSNFFNVTTQPC